MTQGINATQNVNSPFKSVVKTAAVAAGAASLYYALKHGQVADTFEGSNVKRAQLTLVDGYKKLGTVIKDKATEIVGAAKNLFAGKTTAAESVARDTEAVACEIFGEFGTRV